MDTIFALSWAVLVEELIDTRAGRDGLRSVAREDLLAQLGEVVTVVIALCEPE
jgi:hypothetical protein